MFVMEKDWIITVMIIQKIIVINIMIHDQISLSWFYRSLFLIYFKLLFSLRKLDRSAECVYVCVLSTSSCLCKTKLRQSRNDAGTSHFLFDLAFVRHSRVALVVSPSAGGRGFTSPAAGGRSFISSPVSLRVIYLLSTRGQQRNENGQKM